MRRLASHGLWLLALVAGLGLAAIWGAGRSWSNTLGPADGRPLVVTSINILADLASQVGGERVRVHSLLGPGQDPHTYEPVPRDALALARAQLVLLNGHHLDFWAERLLADVEQAQDKGGAEPAGTPVARRQHPQVVRLAEEIKAEPLPWPGSAGGVDPHMWMDPLLAAAYVERVRDALVAIDPAGAPVYRQRAEAMLADLHQLDRWIRAQLASVPPERRKLVTTHDAYRYFGRRYGLQVLETVWGVSTEEEPSAFRLARLFQQLRTHGVPAFVETTINPQVMAQIAEQAGVRIGGRLYADALGPPGSGAETYVGMMRHNVSTLVAALRRP